MTSSPVASGPSRTVRGLRVAMALYADATFDSRVLREAETLAAEGHEVTMYCLAGAPPADAPYRVVALVPPGASVLPDGSSPFLRTTGSSRAGQMLAGLRWALGYARTVRAWGRLVIAAAGEVDVWHVHDLTGLLAVAPFAPRTATLVYDSHEIFVETGTAARLPGPARRLLRAYERRLTRRASALITVNDGYARVLARRLRPQQTVVVRNCPRRWTPSPDGGSQLRAAAGIPGDAPIALYHGAFARHRGIEELMAALSEPGMGRVHAVLLGFGPLRDELIERSREPGLGGRVHVLDAVAPDHLLKWVSGADVDVIALQRSSLNHWLCTPNKLWESFAAGVPVVVSDFPGMRQVVLADPAEPLGVTCDPARPASIASAILDLVNCPADERRALRDRCRAIARQRWNWEVEGEALLDVYRRLARSQGALARMGRPDGIGR
jgi:glycosyltransferase involved in cell wall biosynthesis